VTCFGRRTPSASRSPSEGTGPSGPPADLGSVDGDVPLPHGLRCAVARADGFAKSPLRPGLLLGENLGKERSWWMSITLLNLSPSRALFIT